MMTNFLLLPGRLTAHRTVAAGLCALALLAGAPIAVAETLAQALELALQADARLVASQHQMQAAQSGLAAAQALGSPQVAIDVAYNRLSDEPAFKLHIAPLPATALPFSQQAGALVRAGVTVPLYTSGRLGNAAQAADATLQAARQDSERTRQDVKLATAENYIQVLRAQHLLALSESNLTTLQAHAQDVQAFLDRGLVARADWLAAQTALASAEQDQLRANTALRIAQAAYNRPLGRDLGTPLQLEDIAPVLADAGTDPGHRTAATTSPPPPAAPRAEVLALASQAQALQAQSAAALAAGRPQVLLSAGYNQIQNRYLAKEQLWNVAVGLRWELFDGGLGRAQADALAARAQAVRAAQADAQSQIDLQQHAAQWQLDESRSRIRVAQAALAQAEESLRVARDRYQSSVGSHTEVLDAQTRRIQSQSNHFNAIYDNVLAAQRLQRARGEL